MTDLPWYTNPTSTLELATWLVDRGEFITPEDVLHFYEKPWHWEPEWAEYCAEIDGRIEAHQAATG